MTQELKGKTILLTGATEGIGKAAAIELGRRGASLVLVGRSAEKTERVLAEIRQKSGNEDVRSLLGDLSTIAGIRGVAAAFKRDHDRLDVLANNAGGMFLKLERTSDGLDYTFALNHLAYFLLTQELWGLLCKTPGARVVSTSSAAHRGGRLDLADFPRRESGRTGFGSYCDSKLANILFTRELARRLAGTGVVANCYHPGFVRSAFAHNNGAFARVAVQVAGALFARSVEKGAETLVWLAASPEAGQLTGQYLQDKKPATLSKLAQDDALAEKLWELSEKLVSAEPGAISAAP